VKRRLLKLCLFLLLGAVVNVAVAWGLAAWVIPHRLAMHLHFFLSDNRAPRWRFTVRSGVGTTVIWSIQTGDSAHLVAKTEVRPDLLSPWSRINSPPIPLVLDPPQTEYARGWPMLSLMCVSIPDQAAPKRGAEFVPSFSQGIRLSVVFDPASGQPIDRCLPLRPIWSGFVINTAFYATILWLLFAAPFALRRELRRRRNICPHCAYPIGTNDVCTECGKAVKALGTLEQPSRE
jgi:hypothetical protein